MHQDEEPMTILQNDDSTVNNKNEKEQQIKDTPKFVLEHMKKTKRERNTRKKNRKD